MATEENAGIPANGKIWTIWAGTGERCTVTDDTLHRGKAAGRDDWQPLEDAHHALDEANPNAPVKRNRCTSGTC